MLILFKLKGRDYSIHKNDFKSILKQHGLRWRGTFSDPWWGSGSEKVTAVYERDEDRNITISASLTWDGETEGPFLKDLREWAIGAGAEERALKRSETASYIDDLRFFELVYKPQVEYLEATGRPRSWIEKDLQHWENERVKRFGDQAQGH